MSSYPVVDKAKVSELFSKAAKDYDKYALLQAEISEEILTKFKKDNRSLNILDVGSGTGRLIERLSLIFPEAKILGLDFAFGMLEVARKKIFHPLVQANAQFLPLKKDIFDLIISNVSYQWIDNLSGAFNQVCNVLKKDGKFFISIFGKDTLKELKSSFSKAFRARGREVDSLYVQLPDEACVYEALAKAKFKDIKIKRNFRKMAYQDLFSLLNWLKATGSNYSSGDLFSNLGLRQILDETAEVYRERYHDNGNIYASFEVIYAEARK